MNRWCDAALLKRALAVAPDARVYLAPVLAAPETPLAYRLLLRRAPRQVETVWATGDVVEHCAAEDPRLTQALAHIACAPTRDEFPELMGILNVTPDSFSDGGRYVTTRDAVDHGLRMIEAGASIIDIGGESTRPGALPVPVEEEIARTVPVIEALVRETNGRGVRLSIDTRHAAAMRAALAAGATIVNDVTALTGDGDSLAVAAAAAPHIEIVLMHMQGQPQTMQQDPRYDHAALDIYDYLEARIAACEAAGIARSRLVVDPGIGFGKRTGDNAQILHFLPLYRGLARVLLGASRKSFIAQFAGSTIPVEARLPGSLAVALYGALCGASILRVHDVEETRQALAVLRAMVKSKD
jgi:dihydropteroate synthase